jgi:hypothetical protein
MRKRRTREHVLADLSANHFERLALECGYSVERTWSDYGIDLVLYTYAANGEIDNGQVFVQLKATEEVSTSGAGHRVAVSKSDLEHWLKEPMPVILVLYVARGERAYWTYVQAYFESMPGFDLAQAGPALRIPMSRDRLLDASALRQFAAFRDDVLSQVRGVIHHYDQTP